MSNAEEKSSKAIFYGIICWNEVMAESGILFSDVSDLGNNF